MTNDVPDFEVEPADEPEPKAPPIQSRFLFVDVAAQRAKQLRRGAQPRVPLPGEGPPKLERLAMAEVNDGLVHYTLPPLKPPAGEGSA
jgi:DNA-directed RNA polymerase subunit K/omega